MDGENQEHWKPIPGYEGIYEVSDLGNVRSLPRLVYYPKRDTYRKHKGRVLTCGFFTGGYPMVQLAKGGCCKGKLVAHLVAQAFCPSDLPPHIRRLKYRNGDKADCRAENLEWTRMQKY